MKEESTDVVIVGAGPTGLMLARELLLAGVSPVVVERLPRPGAESKALGLGGHTLDVLEHRGLLARFEAAALESPAFPIDASRELIGRLAHFGGVPLPLDRTDGRAPRFLNILQRGTEHCLDACAAELGAKVRRGWELTDLQQDDDTVTLSMHTDSGPRRISARFVVGCDGAHSRVRKLTGIAFPGTDPTELLRLADLELPPDFVPPPSWGRGRAPLVPLAEGARIVTKEPMPPDLDRNAPMTFEELAASVRRVYGIELPPVRVRWMSRFTDTSRLAETYRHGRVLLAGDAAHVHLPAGGPGINAGIHDAVNLAWKLAATVRGSAPEDLLDTYHRERHPIGERLMMHTRAQAAMLHATAESTALRALLADLSRHRAVARDLVDIQQGYGVRYELAEPGVPCHAWLGRWAPDLTLVTETGTQRLADRMHGARPLLLDQAARPRFDALAAAYSRDVNHLRVRVLEGATGIDAILIRPDGHVAWAIDGEADDEAATASLGRALARWFRPAAHA